MFPILLELEGFALHSYGLFVLLGGIASVLFWKSRRSRMGIASDNDFWLFVNALLIGGFLGGRLLYLAEYVPLSSSGFWRAAFALKAGFSILGAFGGVSAALAWFCRSRGVAFLGIFDYVCQAAPVWHALGRLGCFAAGCCYGRPSDLPWAAAFTDPRAMVPAELLGRPLHPAQLYDALGNLAIAAGLYLFLLPAREAGRLRPGVMGAAYFASYGALRFALEPLRGDAVALGGLLSAGQALSLGLVAASAAIAAAAYRKPCTQP